MKPIATEPLTEDDELIWWRVALRAPMLPLQLPARAADRRDADLMLAAQLARGGGSWEPIAINRVGRFGGYLPAKRPRVWLS